MARYTTEMLHNGHLSHWEYNDIELAAARAYELAAVNHAERDPSDPALTWEGDDCFISIEAQDTPGTWRQATDDDRKCEDDTPVDGWAHLTEAERAEAAWHALTGE